MKIHSIIILLAVLTISSSCGTISEYGETERKADLRSIHEHNQLVENALRKGNLEGLMKEVSDDAIYMPPNQPALHGKQAIQSFYKQLFNDFSLDTSFSSETDLVVAGNWAIFRATLRGRLTRKSDTRIFVIHNKFVNILRKDSDGSWKIWRDIWNSDLPYSDVR